jgi:hypothetical protein
MGLERAPLSFVRITEELKLKITAPVKETEINGRSTDFADKRQQSVGTVRLRTKRFEVFMAVTMKNGVFWDVMPCGSCKNRRFGGT